jgi:hypothetical protein
MRNRFEGRDQHERGFNDRSRTEMGHERGFGMANGRAGGFDRDPHRVDVHHYGGREDGMWSSYDYAADPASQRPSGYAPAHFERARGEYEPGHAPPRQGRLPKGYTRSDERIREDVCERLGMALDASEVEVRVEGGIVSLSGTVLDRQTKYQLEEISEHVLGVTDVQNQVTILRGAGNSLVSTQRMELDREDSPRRSRH